MTSELKTGYSCPSHSHNPIPTGFCSSWLVGVVALMERGRQLFPYLIECLFQHLLEHNETNTAFLVSHLVQKKKRLCEVALPTPKTLHAPVD